MFARCIVISRLIFLIVLLYISSAGAQFLVPWVEPPPATPADGDVNVTIVDQFTAKLTAEEGILGGSVLAVLRFNLSGSAPTKSSGDNCFIRLGVSYNDSNSLGKVDIISDKELDFESGNPKGRCTFTIYSTFPPQTRDLNLEVLDLNDNTPLFTNFSRAIDFNENKIGELWDFDAEDGDAGDTEKLIFSLKALVGDISSFSIDSSTGLLSVVKELDFEKQQYFLFSVVVADGRGRSSSVEVSVNVVDQKDTDPIWKQPVPYKSIDEESDVGETVFTVQAQDGDIAINDEIIYSLYDPRESFSIDPNSGAVQIAKKIDRDIEDFDPYFDFVITATCKNYPNSTSNSSSTVLINDLNDKIPFFDKLVYDFNDVDEGYKGRLAQMEILISDPDLQDAGSYTVKIEGPPDVTQYLQISPEKGRNRGIFSLTVTSADLLDYEDVKKRNVTFTVVATEVLGTQTNTSVVNIFSRDVNDNSPLFTKQIFEASIVENEEMGLLVTTANAIDADISDDYGQPSVRYSFVEIEASRYLTIDNRTGEIRTAVKIDRESIGTSLNYTLQAIDKNGDFDGKRTYANLNIKIKDVNDDPPVFKPPSVITFNLLENEITETSVTNVFASDRDENPDLQFSINWDDSKFYKNRAIIEMEEEWKKTFVLGETSLYNTTAQSNGILTTTVTNTIKVGDALLSAGTCTKLEHSPLDRETFDSVDLCLTVTDLNTDSSLQPDEDQIYFVINIVDVNDNSPVFNDIEEFFIVETTNSAEIVFGSVGATDLDFGDIIVYSISSDGSCANITINNSSGQLKTKDIIDREVTDNITCVITATDNATCSSNATITINVIDINDNPPILTVPNNIIEIYECSEITQSNLTSTLIYQFQATDADAGSYGIVKYMISEQTSEGVDEFAIDLDNGYMTVANCALLDFEKKINYSILVEARDYYRPGITRGSLSDTKLVNIALIDVNDNPPTLTLPGTGCYDSVLESLKLGEEVTTIVGTDKDSPGPNSKMTFTLHEQKRIGEQLPKCKELFRMETDNYSAGRLIVNVSDMLDCKGNYNITIEACDEGDKLFGSQCSGKVSYRICVTDVNNNYPQFVFPVQEGSIVEVSENSPVGDILIYNKTSQLVFNATDDDGIDELNGQILYTWSNGSYNSIFALDKDTGEVTLAKALDRKIASSYELVVVATDKGVPANFNETKLRINVRISNKQAPFFNPTAEQLRFEENSIEEHPFQVSVDEDNEHLYPGESRYDVCYYCVCGNTDNFEIPDKRVNKLKTKKELDRENPPPVPYVIVYTTNDCVNDPIKQCSEIDTTQPQYLNVSIAISDVNDCNPEFSGSLSGGITEGDSPDSIVFPMTVTDQDLNESVTCKIEEKFTVSDPTLENVIKPPFDIDATYKIKLRFYVQANMKGYFALNVTCTDKASHSTTTPIKIYVVRTENKVDIIFNNTQAEVEAKRTEIEEIFTTTLGYLCNVGSVIPYDQSYSAVSHFINQTSNTPVLAGEILTIKSIPEKTNELIARCKNEANLILLSVGPLPTVENTSEALFRILFIVAVVVILIMAILVVFLFFNNRNLNRQVKTNLIPSMSDSVFGSKDSGLNRTGEVVPNPLYSIEASAYSKHNDNFDAVSESSGDSIFIGVENNPEFRNYKKNGNDRVVLEASSLPFQNISRRNPLLEDDGQNSEPNYPPPPPPRTVFSKRPAPPPPVLVLEDANSDGSSDELDDDVNPNVSYGKSMTMM